MCKRQLLLFIELGVTFLNTGLLLPSIIILCQRAQRDLEDQLADMNRKVSIFAVDLRTALQNANSNLNFNKTLQWNYIYYVVLLFGAIVALQSQFGSSSYIAPILLTIASNFVFHVGLYLTLDIQFQIRRERLSTINIELRFNKDRKTKARLLESKQSAIRFLSHPYISLTVLVTVLAGYVLCLVLIVGKTIS